MSLPRPSSDRTAVVTGASSGIGAEIARELSRRGHHVTLVARSEDRLRALAGELAEQPAYAGASVMPCDLGDRAARAALADTLLAGERTVEVLVNNAGLSTLGPVAASDPEAEMGMVEVDVVAGGASPDSDDVTGGIGATSAVVADLLPDEDTVPSSKQRARG